MCISGSVNMIDWLNMIDNVMFVIIVVILLLITISNYYHKWSAMMDFRPGSLPLFEFMIVFYV